MVPLPIEPARPDELAAALRLALRHLPEDVRHLRVTAAQALFSKREIDPAGVLVARHGEKLAGVVVAAALAGAGGLLWPPQVAEEAPELADALVAAAVAWLEKRSARLIQALLCPGEESLAAPLVRFGFRHVTRLHYLRHNLVATPAVTSDLRMVPFRDAEPAIFRDTLLRTYEGTQDCPELNGVRTIEEILAGHKAQGQFRADRWWLALDRDQAVGVALTTYVPDWDGWDLSYVGIVPEARGRGLGRQLTSFVLEQARRARARCVNLAVDERNRIAWELYTRLGFVPEEDREVYLYFLSPRPRS
jgi:ribosomal protein S18 acetylase RimI-like enzyme